MPSQSAYRARDNDMYEEEGNSAFIREKRLLTKKPSIMHDLSRPCVVN
jgi:hypothetical protein